MKNYIFEGKTKEDALEKAVNELNVTEENLIIKLYIQRGQIYATKENKRLAYQERIYKKKY